MDTDYYLDKFQKAADRLDKTRLQKLNQEVAVVEVLNSVCIKLYKKSWATPAVDPLTAESRIFFSVWISDPGIVKQQLFYNIHALKLRKLKGYAIESRKFATIFRAGFKEFEHQWPNVRVDFGPLTLMEGWVVLNPQSFVDDILKLADQFLAVEHLIDATLAEFEKG